MVEDARRRRLLSFTFHLATVAAVAGPATSASAAADIVVESSSLKKSSTEDIIASPLDERKYEAFTLDNGLRVLIISDPSLSTAAAAMDVHVGACSDPVAVPVSMNATGKSLLSICTFASIDTHIS